MKLKKLSLLLLPAFIWSCSGDKAKMEGYSMLEEVTKTGDEIRIPYKKFQLDNGLTVVIHEDNSDPVVHVDVTYHVGSAREEIGRSGFAHFFEHMMFQGSEHVGDEEHFKTVTEAGGTLNGTTNRDRTNYFETLPSNQLEVALWLESDRMGWLLDAVTQEKFEIQRATVKNERGQNYDNRPYGMLGEISNQALYPHGHPYSWPTIGYIDELNEATLQDLKDFFLRWYGPNNATLTIAGDVDAMKAMELVKKYFGPINRGPEVENMPAQMASLDADRYISHEDNIRFPLLQMNFPSVPNRHKDEAPLDVLSDILGGGKNSIFYQTFVKSGKAIQASVGNPCSELAGNMSFTVVAYPGAKLSDLEKEMRAAIATFEERGVKDEDLERYKSSFESGMINQLASVRGKGSLLASYQTFTGNADYIGKEMERYMNVTKEDVMRVYNEYIKGKNCVITSYVPKGQLSNVAAADNYTATIGRTEETVLNNYDTLVYNKPADSTFDRSSKPSPGPAPFVQVPNYWTASMDNGISAIGTQSDEVPLVSIQISVPAGHRNETLDKAGVADLTAAMMNEGTESYTAEELSEELEKLGSSIRVNASGENITLSINSLAKNIDRTLELAEEVLMKPRFDQEDFARVKKQTLEGIANRVNQASQLASDAFAKLMYGENHINAIPSSGTATTVNALTLNDVKDYYGKYLSPKVAKLVVVGSIDKDAVLNKLSFLNNWKGESYEWPAQTVASAEPGKIYFMDKEGAAQSEIRIGYLTDMVYDATGEYFKAGIMNYQLGANFNSRINIKLREKKGYTYGARSLFFGSTEPARFYAYAGVKKEATDSALYEFMWEIENYVDGGITEEELAFVKKSLTLSEALDYETPRQKAGFLRRILDYKLDADFVKKQAEILKEMTSSEIKTLAQKHLVKDKMIMVVVGDKSVVWEGLNKLGYPVVEINKEAEAI